jgi:hypothetical protein
MIWGPYKAISPANERGPCQGDVSADESDAERTEEALALAAQFLPGHQRHVAPCEPHVDMLTELNLHDAGINSLQVHYCHLHAQGTQLNFYAT